MKKGNFFCPSFIFLFLLFLFLSFQFSLAQVDPQVLEGENYLDELGQGTDVLEKRDLILLIFSIVRYLLGLIGVAAVIVIISAGYSWMTAAGNEEKVKKAKAVLQNGIIGLVVIMIAYALTIFVFKLIRGEL
ncbi:MAG: pilin [Patescibacteria group bacterium]|nr:pilin [Patescibacteria group bacterium]